MANTAETAARWVEFIATHPAFPVGAKLWAAFHAGKITRLCDCGCHSFDFAVTDEASVPPLANAGGHGAVCEMSFEASESHSRERKSIEFIVFADQRGHFAGIEVDYCANSYPVPDGLVIHEPPFHVGCSNSLAS